MDTFLTTLFGIFLRIGIPVVITILAGWFLYRLDAHWQAEVHKDAAQGKAVLAANTGCWNQKNCPPTAKERCDAYAHPEMPCWQTFRKSNGELREGCIGCEVLQKAPVPVRA